MKRALVLFALLAFACTTSQQQPPPQPAAVGVIEGVVQTDGSPLPGATVTITTEGQKPRTVITDANGHYAVGGLPPGTYTVVAELVGLNRVSQRVTLTAQQGVSLVSELSPAAVAETITVTAAAPDIGGPAVMRTAKRSAEPGPSEPQYAQIQEHGFIDTRKEQTATFAIDVDRASYANIRRFLNDGYLPPPDAVRIEERRRSAADRST